MKESQLIYCEKSSEPSIFFKVPFFNLLFNITGFQNSRPNHGHFFPEFSAIQHCTRLMKNDTKDLCNEARILVIVFSGSRVLKL